MKRRIISALTLDTLAMLKRRMPGEFRSCLDLIRIDTIGLSILPVPDLYFYADAANKNVSTAVSEILDNCPQHVTTLAISGEVAAVHEAIRIIEEDDNQF